MEVIPNLLLHSLLLHQLYLINLIPCISLQLHNQLFILRTLSSTSFSVLAMVSKELAMEIPTLVRLFKDGTIERLQNSPIVRPSTPDPETGVTSKDIVISENPSISARLFLPKSTQEQENKKLPILVYFHGGGFFFESAFNQLHHTYFNLFTSESNVLVVSIEYRLFPDYPLPAAYQDCWDALKWVASHFAKKPSNSEPWLINHGDSNRIFLGGDSAGGNIVHNVVMRAGAEALPGGVKIFGAFLSHTYFYGSKPIGSEPKEWHELSVPYLVWNMVYPSAPGGIDNPMINPVVAGAPSLAGLGCSCMLVCVAGKDIIRDRGVWYYDAVKESGWKGKLELFEVAEEGHAFHVHNPYCENAKKMIKRFAEFLCQ